MRKLRKEFTDDDLAIVEVYIQEDAQTVRSHDPVLPFNVLLDKQGTVAGRFRVAGIPVVLVIDPKGEITFRDHYVPALKLSGEIKKALKARPSAVPAQTARDHQDPPCFQADH